MSTPSKNRTSSASVSLAGRLQYLVTREKAYKPKAPYRWHFGFIAWVLHRLTGLALAAYIILHLYVLQNLARGPEHFNSMMAAFDSPLIRLMEIGLLGVVVYHSINGLRIVFMDYGPMAEKESYVKYLAATFIIIAAILGVGGLIMLGHVLH
jgi:succinate dehydrogenase / fumarate reductase cytochrome b subunit